MSEATKMGKKGFRSIAAESFNAVGFSKNLFPRFLKRPLPRPNK
ncbi:hypothetical protein ANASTE_00314 [Anaerofustis stercorihominis DSM 17244]|uniref:Uncharacterized protein n=1 Tax=Anaerofustis stercorihominis DSM 17244 TaxID=445971 RepID=B1C6H4_9FIRM|nr:hypothetical protein ANASTE_00314 [Anaerofustis stercorihominis DSM 17244]